MAAGDGGGEGGGADEEKINRLVRAEVARQNAARKPQGKTA